MTAFSENTTFGPPDFTKAGLQPRLKTEKPRRHGLVWLLIWSFAVFLAWLPQAGQAQSGTRAAPATRSGGDTILVVGDSLSAEYGLKRGAGWVALLQDQLAAGKHKATVVNASISGDTTSGGRSRLPALLRQHKPTIVILELGANDALRGLALNMTEQNLTTMAQVAQKAGAKVLLLGMQVPPNYGGAYGATFSGLFEKVAKSTRSALVPFFLKDVADIADAPRLFQRDRIHPNEEAHPIMLANVWPELKKLLK